jgi:hydroxyethylthiazole kinase-like uncharacterized protein yjeF
MYPDDNPLLDALLNRPRDSHKYNFGRVLVIGGSQSMVGAPVLAGKAALRSGAGVVELCVPDVVAAIAAGFDPCLITHGLPSDASGVFSSDGHHALRALASRADVVVLGPGLGRSPVLSDMVRELWRELHQPMVVDADALQALSGWAVSALAEHAGPRILTPHAGEMRHLMAGVRDIGHASRTEWEQAAAEFARHTVSCVILKGAETLITDGGSSMHNSTGNPGLATAGTGDVLSGIIAALLAQKLPPLDAARLGVWVHGKAGDAAAEALGQLAMTATDVIDHLSGVWQSLRPVPGSGVMA